MSNIEDIQCPVCGYYCLGNGGFGCIDKKGLYERKERAVSKQERDWVEKVLKNAGITKKSGRHGYTQAKKLIFKSKFFEDGEVYDRHIKYITDYLGI